MIKGDKQERETDASCARLQKEQKQAEKKSAIAGAAIAEQLAANELSNLKAHVKGLENDKVHQTHPLNCAFLQRHCVIPKTFAFSGRFSAYFYCIRLTLFVVSVNCIFDLVRCTRELYLRPCWLAPELTFVYLNSAPII